MINDRKLQMLRNIQTEVLRFEERLRKAIETEQGPTSYSRKDYAACKRGALDLKNELTNLTQDSKYLYGNN